MTSKDEIIITNPSALNNTMIFFYPEYFSQIDVGVNIINSTETQGDALIVAFGKFKYTVTDPGSVPKTELFLLKNQAKNLAAFNLLMTYALNQKKDGLSNDKNLNGMSFTINPILQDNLYNVIENVAVFR